MRRYFSLSHMAAGFIAVLVGFTSSAAIIFSAVSALGATQAETTSWFWALGLGMFATSVGLSLRFKAPILTAWSTPGAALLVTALAGVPMAEAMGAFLFSSLLIVLCGVFGLFDALMKQVPKSLAAALLAGVLARFALDAVTASRTAPWLLGAMTAAYLAGKRWWPRYAVPGVLLAGLATAALQGTLRWDGVRGALAGSLAMPVWTTPAFSLTAMVGLALPLFIVTMASQNLPGVAAQRACGYDTPVSPVVGATGLATTLLAPFGGYAFNLAAITAAICMGREAHEDPARRYVASAMAGLFYLVVGVAGGAVAGLLAAFPRELVVGVAGLALLGTIAGGLASALKDEAHRDAALLTFLVTLSGVSFFGIASAFWGLLAGAVALAVLRR